MGRKRSKPVSIWTALSDATTRSATRLQRAVARSMVNAAVEQANAASRAARKALTGVASPTATPTSRGSGRWESGQGGLGPALMRRYLVFVPAGVTPSRPAPLLLLLHGCKQDAASFAATTRAAALARAERCIVLLPEQSLHANPYRCWNWFRSDTQVAGESAILMALTEQVSRRYPVRRERRYVMGLSAGASMALTLVLQFPERFAAVGAHSGAVPHSASNALQGRLAMRGDREPDLASLRLRLAGGRLPPLIVLHGDDDAVVSIDNAAATTQLWLDLLPGEMPQPGPTRTLQRGARRAFAQTDWMLGSTCHVRQIRIAGLGHAWSGGAARQAFSDPGGPDALTLAWRFFAPRVKATRRR